MSYTLFGIPNCDTVRKARKWLSEHSIDFEFHDYRKNPISEQKVADWLSQIDRDRLINKNSKTYKDLSEKKKDELQNGSNGLHLVVENPSMIKRPVLVKGNELLATGFKAENYADLFGLT